ncbi:hypothetical protein D3C85_1322220 [compost metagenome]
MVCTNQSCRNNLGFGKQVIHNILLCFFYLPANFMGFIKQGFPLVAFCFTKATLIFVGHVFILAGLFLKRFNGFHIRVTSHLMIKCSRKQFF